MIDFKNLLGKENKSSWQDIAQSYFSSKSKDSNKIRNLMLGQLIVGTKQKNMEKKVLKNLEQIEKEKVFEMANMNAKHKKYDTLMTNNEKYIENPSYFYNTATTAFNKQHPNYFQLNPNNKSSRATKEQEIKEYEKALIENHESLIKSGNFEDKRMTKEVFFKPFEDYYDGRAEEAASSKNLSLIHNGWDKFTNKFGKKDILTPATEEAKKQTATRSVYDFLLDPVAFTNEEQIPSKSFDEDTFTYTHTEGAKYIISEMGNDNIARQKAIRTLSETNDNGEAKVYTRNELDLHIIGTQTNFDAIIENNYRINRAFDTEWKLKNNKKTTPTADDATYVNYYLRKANNLDAANKVDNVESRKLRSDIFELADLEKLIDQDIAAGNYTTKEKHPMSADVRRFERAIAVAGIGKINAEMFNIVADSFADPYQAALINPTIEEYARETDTYDENKTYRYKTQSEYLMAKTAALTAGYQGYLDAYNNPTE